MGLLELILTLVSPAYAISTGAAEVYAPILAPIDPLKDALGVGDPGTVTEGEKAVAGLWLGGLAATGITLAAAPTLYRAFTKPRKGKKAKDRDAMAQSLDDASMRATTLAAAMLPAAGLPIAYITVQALEAKGVLSKALGDAVQTLIAAGAVAPAIGGMGDLLKAVK